MKVFKRIMIALAIIIGIILLIVLSYFIYLQVNYYRIGDKDLEIKNNSEEVLELGADYKAITYNVGFGAYDRDYSFFLDEGILKNGKKTTGKQGKAFSKEHVLRNTNGAIDLASSLNPDFLMLEEVDTNGSRSYHVNQATMFMERFSHFSNTFANNFHSSYLVVPVTDMHGKNESGLLTMSKFKMKSSKRIELPISQNMISKLFDLDRCLNLVRYEIQGSDKELVMVTAHFSAYDEGGKSKALQLALLKELLEQEYALGNYVIVGGDFNHDIANTIGKFETNQEKPTWVGILTNEELPEHFSFASDASNPSCRGADVPWDEGTSFSATVDGFIVSDNILVKNVKNIVEKDGVNIKFMYSDHNPVLLEFSLKN